MTKFIAFLSVLAGAAMTAAPVHAAPIPGTPLWACTITAELENNSMAFIVGGVDKRGPAKINCTSTENLVSGRSFSKDVYVEIVGPQVGLDINFVTHQRIHMATASLGVRDYRELLGRHSLSIGANANLLFLEGGAQAGLEFSDRVIGAKPSVEISNTRGLGATISIQKMTVYPSEAAYLKEKARRAALRAGNS